jgi:hypothetical protein
LKIHEGGPRSARRAGCALDLIQLWQIHDHSQTILHEVTEDAERLKS